MACVESSRRSPLKTPRVTLSGFSLKGNVRLIIHRYTAKQINDNVFKKKIKPILERVNSSRVMWFTARQVPRLYLACLQSLAGDILTQGKTTLFFKSEFGAIEREGLGVLYGDLLYRGQSRGEKGKSG